ncbi:hypothetical protein CRUP_023629 [Coryphaenoides rupestris]|nr:hypothetical protein CRUP_023629 [Coryphaenoides rupestris]
MEVLGVGISDCVVRTPSMITCLSPAAGQSLQTSLQFFLNGVLYTRESPASAYEGAEEWEEEEEKDEPAGGHFPFDYVEDPQFFTANKEKLIKHHPGEPLTLVIMKGRSDLELAPEEYSVLIGSYTCNISFHNDQLFHMHNRQLAELQRERAPCHRTSGEFPPHHRQGAAGRQ